VIFKLFVQAQWSTHFLLHSMLTSNEPNTCTANQNANIFFWWTDFFSYFDILLRCGLQNEMLIAPGTL